MIGLIMMAAVGGFFTVDDLGEMCRAHRTDCVLYVSGVSDAVTSFQATKTFIARYCPGPDISTGQTTDVVVKYLKQHPDTRFTQAADVVRHALYEAFPCRKGKR